MIPLQVIQATSILTKTGGFLRGFDYTLNLWRGCSFDCSYCYAPRYLYDRELEAEWGRWLIMKENAADLLRKASASGRLDGAALYVSSVSDPYPPEERDCRITRQCLEVLADRPPRRLVIQTRGPLIERDTDLLVQLKNCVRVSFSLGTDDDAVRRAFEPRCASVGRRLLTMERLHDAGIEVFATVAPTLPCNPGAFARALDHRVTGIIVSGFHDDGANGRNTRQKALEIIHSRGWGFCLQPEFQAKIASVMRRTLGARVAEGREAFAALSI